VLLILVLVVEVGVLEELGVRDLYKGGVLMEV
jgi:hypothetical protein